MIIEVQYNLCFKGKQMKKVKVIYDKVVEGFNPGDAAHYEASEAAKIVKSGDAHYAVTPGTRKSK